MADTSIYAVTPGSFDVAQHFYPRVPNARIHPLVRHFLNMGNERIARRYCHLHPEVKPEAVIEALAFRPRFLRWAGADLFHATTERGIRRNVVVEVNSSPSGQKSMPLLTDEQEQAGYHSLLAKSFVPMLKRRHLPKGRLAVLSDKNVMETTGYAAALADLTEEDVLHAHLPVDTEAIRTVDGVIELDVPGEGWQPVRAAFRYVTQRPWTRIPPITRTAVYNPVVACLAGGRNKLLAAKAYDLYNARLAPTGLAIRVPETIWDVSRREVPLWVARMGGFAVVKNPYSNAGQGVWTITSKHELDAFMELEHRYDRFIVQALIGNAGWSSRSRGGGRLYHIGTVPNKRDEIYAADLRFMVGAGPEGFFPVSLYARRARVPLAATLEAGADSWSMLGTNLSVKLPDGSFTTEPERLMLMDIRDFNSLGLGIDDLTEGYLQTVLAVAAIDDVAQQLITQRGTFRRKFFASLVPDPRLVEEIIA